MPKRAVQTDLAAIGVTDVSTVRRVRGHQQFWVATATMLDGATTRDAAFDETNAINGALDKATARNERLRLAEKAKRGAELDGEMRAIIDTIAATEPFGDGGYCIYCGADLYAGRTGSILNIRALPPDEVPHTLECIWRRSQAVRRAMEEMHDGTDNRTPSGRPA